MWTLCVLQFEGLSFWDEEFCSEIYDQNVQGKRKLPRLWTFSGNCWYSNYSQDFATSSLKGEVAVDDEEEEARIIEEELQLYHVVDRKRWEYK